MNYFGLDAMSAVEKQSMRDLAIRGGPFTNEERLALLDYCQSDVDATAMLARKMSGRIDLPRALIRGRYVNCVARMESAGIPVDSETLGLLRGNWQVIRTGLISRIDRDRVFDGGSFRQRRWEEWVSEHGIVWPRLPSGVLSLDQDTFKEMSRIHPEVAPYKELRITLNHLRIHDLPVGPDGRNRTMLSPFGSRTGRNQPRSSQFIFGPAKWLRTLVRPEPGRALAYLDFEQQEFGIAAALSRDLKMMEAYKSDDPYLAFAKQAGAVPPDATRDSHPKERALFKTCSLGVQYSMGEQTLASRIRQSHAHARELINLHRATYSDYWRWSEGVQDYAIMNGGLTAAFGWRVRSGSEPNPCFLRNFPLQANGAEILRLACIFAVEAGVTLCAPVHDALLIESDEDQIEEAVSRCEAAMEKASQVVLGGFSIRVEAKVILYPERFTSSDGSRVWEEIKILLSELSRARPACTKPTHLDGTPVSSLHLL